MKAAGRSLHICARARGLCFSVWAVGLVLLWSQSLFAPPVFNCTAVCIHWHDLHLIAAAVPNAPVPAVVGCPPTFHSRHLASCMYLPSHYLPAAIVYYDAECACDFKAAGYLLPSSSSYMTTLLLKFSSLRVGPDHVPCTVGMLHSLRAATDACTLWWYMYTRPSLRTSL
jgi:hypothetical protein